MGKRTDNEQHVDLTKYLQEQNFTNREIADFLAGKEPVNEDLRTMTFAYCQGWRDAQKCH